tara:strand:+ start:1112 stop:1678 length:567 start_codon:yes stop_codon:yes gene_type:complete
MNNYEIVYIIHPALQEGRLVDIKSKIHEKLTSLKGKVLYDDNWGKKKLAYAIDKQKYGTYLFCQFLLDGKNIQEINTDCELNSNILRHLITRIDSSQVLDEKDKKELKNQNKTDDKSSKETEKEEVKVSEDVEVVEDSKEDSKAEEKEEVKVSEDLAVQEDSKEEDLKEEDSENDSNDDKEENNSEEK